jgi:hypothetical protein
MAKQANHEIEFLLSVADVLLLDAQGNQLASATLKSHNMTQSVDTTEIRGGQRNDVLATIKNNKTIEVTIEDVQQQRDFIAMMLGAEIQAGQTVEAYVLPQGLTVKDGAVTLPHEPKSGETVVYTKADGTPVEQSAISSLSDGEIIFCSGYKYDAQAEKMVIASDKFAGSFKMVLDEQVFDADMQVIARKQTVFHKVIPNDSFTLEGSAERAEKTISYTFTVALESGQQDLGYIAYIPVAAE